MKKVDRRNVCCTPLGVAELNIVVDLASITDVCQTKQNPAFLLDGMVFALQSRTEPLKLLQRYVSYIDLVVAMWV